MRITFVLPTPNLSGGIRVVAIYAQRLALRGHKVAVVWAGPPQPGWFVRTARRLRGRPGWSPRPQTTHLDELGVVCHGVPVGPITDVHLPDADVVVATWWETAEWVANLSPAKGAKAYFVQGHEIHEGQPRQRVEATYRLPLAKIAVASWLARLMASQYGDANTVVVANSVDLEQFQAPPRGKNSRPVVGMMYSSMPYKGCDLSLAAFDRARQKLPDLRLVAFGRREVSPLLPLPPGTQWFFQPDQSRIRDIYARCDAWLVGSRAEGFGLPILEAMACRTPVISFPVGAAPELLGSGGGLLVRANDSADMARAIVEICSLTDPAWRAVSDAALETARAYSWDDATSQFEAALGRIAEYAHATPTCTP